MVDRLAPTVQPADRSRAPTPMVAALAPLADRPTLTADLTPVAALAVTKAKAGPAMKAGGNTSRAAVRSNLECIATLWVKTNTSAPDPLATKPRSMVHDLLRGFGIMTPRTTKQQQ